MYERVIDTNTHKVFSEESFVDSHDRLKEQLVQVRKYLRNINQRTRRIEKSYKPIIKRTGFNEQELELLRSNIMPLVESAMAKKNPKQMNDFLDTFIDSFDDIRRGVDYATEVMSIEKVSEKQKSILLLYAYLSISEGIYCEAIQQLSFVLLENSHDIYDPRRMKFAKVCGDLDEIDMFVKLQFLEEHGFKSVVEAFDRKLRNAIAHQKIIVEDSGDIVDPVTQVKILDIKTMATKIKTLIGMSALLPYTIALEVFSSHARSLKKTKLPIEKALSRKGKSVA